MRRSALVVVAALAVVLGAGTVPAFTAGSGSVVATVFVEPPPGPCLTLNRTSVDFRTLPLSHPALASTPTGTSDWNVLITSCSVLPQPVSFAASDATTASGSTWAVADTVAANTCAFGTDVFAPGWTAGGLGGGRLFKAVRTPYATIPPGETYSTLFTIQMPCRGSAGVGEVVTMSFDILATVA